MQFVDYYKILGVEPTADDKTIKTAYRKLARKYHPDVNKEAGAEDKFKEVAEAYEVLKNAEKRAEFDQLRQYAQQGGDWQAHARQREGGGFSGESGGGFHFDTNGDMGDFSDFFESIFGGAHRASGHSAAGGRQPFKQAGRDVELELPLFLEEVVSGNSKSISYAVPSYDSHGRRLADETKTLNIKIPKGVISGERIRLKGQGASGVGDAPSGDLYLKVKFAPHPVFDVKDYDLTVSLPIAPWEAALGAKISVATLNSKITLTLPENSQAGQKFRLKGKGLPMKKEGEVGDLYVVLKIVMPPTLDEDSKILWKELAEKNKFDPRVNGGKK